MTVKSKDILIVTSEFPPQPGGIGTHAYHLASYLQDAGYHVQVIVDSRSDDGLVEADFDSSLAFKVHRIANRSFRFRMYLNRLQLLFRILKNVDLVIASGKFSLWSVAFSTLFYRKTFVAIVHGTEVNFQPLLLRTSIDWSLKRFTKVICVSHYTKSLIDRLHLKHVVVIPNGIDLSKWSSNTMKPIALKGKPKLVTVGHVTERKGQLQVIKHLPELLEAFPELHYHCIGIPTEQERCLEIAKTLNVVKHITFHGMVDEPRLKSLLLGCDVFVMLSETTATGDVEGFGIAILEANAFGIPSIGAKGCGIEDAIQHGKSGFLIEVDDSKAFLNALTTLLEQKKVFSEQAKAWAKQHDWNIVVERYVEVLNRYL